MMKPVALVRMVVTRKVVVRAGTLVAPIILNITTMPATMAIRLITTWVRTSSGHVAAVLVETQELRLERVEINFTGAADKMAGDCIDDSMMRVIGRNHCAQRCLHLQHRCHTLCG